MHGQDGAVAPTPLPEHVRFVSCCRHLHRHARHCAQSSEASIAWSSCRRWERRKGRTVARHRGHARDGIRGIVDLGRRVQRVHVVRVAAGLDRGARRGAVLVCAANDRPSVLCGVTSEMKSASFAMHTARRSVGRFGRTDILAVHLDPFADEHVHRRGLHVGRGIGAPMPRGISPAAVRARSRLSGRALRRGRRAH